MRRLIAPLFAVALVLGSFAALPDTAAGQPEGPRHDFQGEGRGLRDADARPGPRNPDAAQRRAAAVERAHVRWNHLGTPQAVTAADGFIATGLSADPVQAAREWASANQELLGLDAEDLEGLEVVRLLPVGAGHTVVLGQTFDGFEAGIDGLLTLAIVDGNVALATSSLTADTTVTGAASLSAQEAIVAAAEDAGLPLSAADLGAVSEEDGWTVVETGALTHPARAKLVAVPTPRDGVRVAWHAVLIDNPDEHAEAFSHFIDAENGETLVRHDLVDRAQDNPEWAKFPVSPPLDYSSTDTRERWCWDPALGCDRVLNVGAQGVASPHPWDVNPIDEETGVVSFTTDGNHALGVHNWFSNNPFTVGTVPATPSPDREYVYPWTNQWFEERCNPDTTFTSPEQNDIDAAITNMFAGHNRMHDWSYHLGFTEEAGNLQKNNFGRGGLGGDPEQGNAQAGGVTGGPPTYAARDNANQITPPDGIPAITNMYLWQPIPGAFYAPCVDGDYDMTVIGHEYTHAITNRMVHSPAVGIGTFQGRAMGESWSDFVAMEHLHQYGLVPLADENPWAVGPYVTADPERGIRNYGMNDSPLNFSNVGYDLTGPQVHADGEIWSAVNFAIREAMVARHGAGTPALQEQCADGALDASDCPGNYRWIQLVFDSLPMLQTSLTMLDARDAMIAADLVRFGRANEDLLWNTFARFGFGQDASTTGGEDGAPIPDFTSPHANEGTLVFKAVGQGNAPIGAELYVGHYEARTRPVADTDPATSLSDTVQLVPGTYDLLVRADGYGTTRLRHTVRAGQVRDLPVRLEPNLASLHNGAVATGDGVNLDKLIDDTEATNWAAHGGPVEGREVTVQLDPSRPAHQIRRVQVSAMLRPPIPDDDPGGQNRFTALRQFEILTCLETLALDCTHEARFTSVFTSPPDAFPAVVPRPRAPDLITRSFDIPRTRASHVRLRVLENQCTGTPGYRGDLDDDPRHDTDCVTGSAALFGVSQGEIVRAAELQVFAR